MLRLLVALLFMSPLALSAAPAREPDAPFRYYDQDDGLNQALVLCLTQDADGFIWVATFGGLNRFDGKTFERLTSNHGLRQNFIQALYVDKFNRVWAGDAGGGLTLIERGSVTQTYEPPTSTRGLVRDIVLDGEMLYLSTEFTGLQTLNVNAAVPEITIIPNSPSEVQELVAAGQDGVWGLDSAGVLYHKPAGVDQAFRAVAEEISWLDGDEQLGVFIAHNDGRIGQWQNDEFVWGETVYPGDVADLIFEEGELAWVATADSLNRVGEPDSILRVEPVPGTVIQDFDGVLWLGTSGGVARYLGDRFEQYSFNQSQPLSTVFSVQPDNQGAVWAGTEEGLVRINADGVFENISAMAELPEAEIRGLALDPDGRTLWFTHIQDQVYKIDTVTLEAEAVFPEGGDIFLDINFDPEGNLWASAYSGNLYRYVPTTGELTKSTIVEAAAIYSLEMDDVGHLWFTVDGVGVYRIDTDNPAVEPERVFDYENLDQDVYMTQLVVQRNSSGNHEAWLSTTRGGVYRIVEGVADRVVNSPAMSDQTVYLVQPLADSTTVLATERGVYQYSSQEDRLEFYGALQGFTAISAKTHATYYDGGQHLWIGTNNGFARMDLSLPLPEVTTPRVSITKLMAGDTRMDESGGELPEVAGGQLLTEFAAVSTRHPQGMEYRYMLDGLDKDWSAPTTNHLIDYSGLAPGKYEFRVSARVAGGAWSMPVTRAFVVPTPYWRTGWFLALAAVASVLLVLGAVQLRLRSVAIANQRLKAEVAARTRSIEAARCELEVSYQQLKNESAERQKSDALRADVEARFRQAYENAPIGMALVNRHGSAYDTNPILEDMFWPDQVSDAPRSLTKIVMPHLEGDFARFFTDFINNEHGNDSQEFECQAASGDIRRLDFLLSAVRDDAGEIRYIVLLTHDVTESRAMTDKLAYQANYDDLTGLTNRRAFERHLKELGVSGTGMEDSYLLFLDLDRFKVVNDTCGHAAGDDLLRTAARTIQGCMRGSDLVARLGGDEFAIILHDTTEQVALDCAERIRAAIHTIDFAWEGDAFRIGVSIGIVPMKYGAMEIEELQQVADAACYAAKEAGRNRVHFVAGDSDEAIAHRGQMRWVQRLNYAIDNDRFSLFGQRIVPLADTGKPGDRIEILLRMRDRVTEKLIPPGAFLPAAERYGLQVRLDQWVVNRVVEMITTDQDPATAANRYWVNLSGASVSDSDFARHVIELVKAADLRPGVLNFEITESTAIRKLDDAARLIADLKAMGCEFALDDFGNGLSSFAYLKRLDVDYLKIDGQFIRDIVDDATDRIFVKSIIDIAHTLGVEVVAEFVENDAILEVVRDMGADYVQGFGVHRPAMFMPGDVTTVVAVPAATGTDSLRVG